MAPRPWLTSSRIDPGALVANVPQPFDSAAEVLLWTATVTVAGSPVTPLAIIVAGRVFWLDETDTTSAHDGTWVCRSADNRRYKATDIRGIEAVESRTVTTPPTIAAANFQLMWLVPAGATGAWAAQLNSLAVSTARGWLFVPPRPGMIIYDKETPSFWHYSQSGAWLSGLGSPSAGTVGPSSLEWPFGLIVETTVLATPPTGSTRLAYVVPAGATGVWAGQEGKVAIGPQGGWTFLTPPEGGRVYNKVTNSDLTYRSGAWSAGAGTLPSIKRRADSAALPISGSYSYVPGTAPTTSNTMAPGSGFTISHTARAIGNLLVVRFRATVDADANQTAEQVITASLFVDTAAAASQWLPSTRTGISRGIEFEFNIVVGDTNAHDYMIRLSYGIGNQPVLRNRVMTLEEFTVS